MADWVMSTYGSNQTLDLGFFKVVIVYRSGSKSESIPDDERYEFIINGLTSKKKFASAEEAKRIALESVYNRLQVATENVKKMLGK